MVEDDARERATEFRALLRLGEEQYMLGVSEITLIFDPGD
jgi:hypothetical protein